VITAVALAAPAALALALAGCSSSGPLPDPTSTRPSAPATPLARALATVRVSGSAPDVQFGRPAEVLRITGGAVSGPYSAAVGYGTGDLAQYARITSDVLGFDPMQAAYAVTAGSPPRSGTLLAGMPSLSAVATKAKALKATTSAQGRQTVYRCRPDYRISATDALGKAFGGGLSPNVLSVSGSDLRVAQAAAGLAAVSGGAHTLADDADYRALADCLGDPLAAELTTDPPVDPHLPASAAATTTPARSVRAVGVGLSGSKGARPADRMCVAADSAGHAARLAATIRAALARGRSTATGQPWKELLTAVSVSTSGSVVAVSARAASGPGGVLLQALQRGDLPGLTG